MEHQTPGEHPPFADTGDSDRDAASAQPEIEPESEADVDVVQAEIHSKVGPEIDSARAGGASGYEPTGRPDVDAVLDRLSDLEGLPPSEHIDIYEDAHRRLHETLLAAGEGREDRAGQP